MTLGLQTVGWLLLGLITGAANVWVIRLAVDRHVRSSENGGRLVLLPGLLARVIIATGLLFLAARTGLLNGAVALLGYWLGRTLMLQEISRQMGEASLTSLDLRSAEQEDTSQSLRQDPTSGWKGGS